MAANYKKMVAYLVTRARLVVHVAQLENKNKSHQRFKMEEEVQKEDQSSELDQSCLR